MCLKKNVFTIIFIVACTAHSGNIEKIFDIVKSRYSHAHIEKFKNAPEDQIMKEFYSSFRSDFAQIAQDMKRKKVDIPQGEKISNGQKSYIILNAWHRHLNGKPEGIEQMTKEIIEENAKLDSCYHIRREAAQETFRKITVADTIKINVPVEIRGQNTKTTVLYGCPIGDWKDFNSNKDLMIEGIVTKMLAYGTYDSYNIYFRVTHLSDENTYYFYEKVTIGDTVQIDVFEYGRPIQEVQR